MHYVGGKQKNGGHRIAAQIRRVAAIVDTREIIEPMCGGLSVTARLGGLNVQASDACRPLIALYLALRDGWVPPEVVTRETWEFYRALQDDPDRQGDPMLAFVGFGCSCFGAWFSSYVERKQYSPKYIYPAATAAAKSLANKLRKAGDGVQFTARDYADAPVTGVWYCDKPYVGTLDYPAVKPFDHARFWEHAAEVSRTVPVLVSERRAPDGWHVLDEWGIQQRMTASAKVRQPERLYVHESWAERLQP